METYYYDLGTRLGDHRAGAPVSIRPMETYYYDLGKRLGDHRADERAEAVAEVQRL